MNTTIESSGMRELDRRSGDGIDVSLLWDPSTDGVFVAVRDARTGSEFRIRVDAADALDAFRHPYAYDERPRSVRDAEKAAPPTTRR